MASPALISLLETNKIFMNSTDMIPHSLKYDVLHSVDTRIRVSLQILKYLSKRLKNDQRLKLVEDKIRITATETDYSLQERMSIITVRSDVLVMNILLSVAEYIYLLSTDLLKTLLPPEVFNYKDQLSYVVRSLDVNLYEVHHQFSHTYIENISSNHKKLRDGLFIFRKEKEILPQKIEIVDFVIALSKSVLDLDLDLQGIIIDGSECGMKKVTLARSIYTDSRMLNRFPIRAWITVLSPMLDDLLHYLMDYFSLSASHQPGVMSYKVNVVNKDTDTSYLQKCVRKFLQGNRYFIVVDNLENSLAWDLISYAFPDNKNGSRVLFISNNIIHSGVTLMTKLFLLDCEFDQLLEMFHNLVFGETSCPQELKIMIPNIINSCGGSMCAVYMVAMYLSTINPTTDNWLIVQESLQNNASMFRDVIHRITSVLLKASEDINSIQAEEKSVYFERCQTENDQTERFKSSTEVAEAKDRNQVGLEDCLEQLVPQLLRSSTQLEKVVVVGMAGIGKTTLAKRIFDDPSICSHFHIRAWVDISQFYQKRSLLIQVLQGITQLTDNEILNETDTQLEEHVYRCLKGRRYLIIMDDIWSTKPWSELERTFPGDKLGSRILLTSRESNLIAGLNCKIVHRMNLLSEKKSWELLRKKVFGHEICSERFEVIGKQIAERCKGLPLALVVVAGVLLKIGKTVESWKVVAKSVSSHVMGSENVTRTIFALSYEHLPDYLKSCFLYIGAFPGAYEIDVRRLIRLWIAEGFIANAQSKCMEDVAEEYLNDLIDRSLVLSGRRRSSGRLRTCRLHDLVMEFCLQEARKEKFLEVIKDFGRMDSNTTIDGHHRFSFHCHNFNDAHLTASKQLAGSALFFRVSSHLVPDILLHYFDFKLLRVLDLISWHFDNFPTEQISKLLLLRYLALTASFELPGILFGLQKLQTLIINGPWLNDAFQIPKLPPEFWRSKSLRHFQLRVVNRLWCPEMSTEANSLNFLQTLTSITLGSCTHESFSSIPNVIKLGVCETHDDCNVDGLWDSFFQNLRLLESIQILKISCFGHNRPLPLPCIDAFPKGLKKLTLRQSNLPWEAISVIGDLPNLEVLKLRNSAFQGSKWETREGGFQSLKYLLIEKTNLMSWEMEGHHFPHLEQLVLRFCEVLEEIPIEIGDIATLTHINLENCGSSVERSAKEIQEECNGYGQNIKPTDIVKCCT